jgi:hypothetical protein
MVCDAGVVLAVQEAGADATPQLIPSASSEVVRFAVDLLLNEARRLNLYIYIRRS